MSEGAQNEIRQIKTWLQSTTLPLYIEVGCGVGMHPIHFALANRDARILAFERTKEKFDKAKRRLLNHQKKEPLENCYISHADASHLLPALLDALKVEGYFFLYPNPYPKSKHTNLRLASMPFFSFAISSLKPGGTIMIATNSTPYVVELQAFAHPDLTLHKVQEIPFDRQPRTHFEKKYLERGEACTEFVFTKTT